MRFPDNHIPLVAVDLEEGTEDIAPVAIPVSPAQRENELKSLAADAEKPKQVREVYDDEE